MSQIRAEQEDERKEILRKKNEEFRRAIEERNATSLSHQSSQQRIKKNYEERSHQRSIQEAQEEEEEEDSEFMAGRGVIRQGLGSNIILTADTIKKMR